MNAATHAPFAAGCWLAGCALFRPGLAPALGGALIAATAAPWPDIDNLGAWAKRKQRGIWLRRGRGRNARYRLRVQLVRWRLHPLRWRLSWLVSLLGTHRRGPCHSLPVLGTIGLVLTGLTALVPWWPWWAGAAIGAGLVSHPLLDLANARPVWLLWPWGRLWEGLGMRVGHAGERVLVRPLAWAGVLAGIWLAVRR